MATILVRKHKDTESIHAYTHSSPRGHSNIQATGQLETFFFNKNNTRKTKQAYQRFSMLFNKI